MKNRVGEFVKAKEISVYRFWKDTGLSRPTAYRICADQNYSLSGDVLDKICDTYKIQPGEILYWEPKTDTQAEEKTA